MSRHRADARLISARRFEGEEGFMKSKRQTTMAKLTRERLVAERRALKLEKKRAAAAAAREAQAAEASGAPEPGE